MSQPSDYDPTTDFSQEEANGVAGRSTVRTPALDAEFANLATTLGEILANLALIQRDDTALADEVVEIHTLSAAVRAVMAAAGSNPRGDWVTATAYAVKDVVANGTGTYLCAVAHTSGVFATDLAAVKWLRIFDTAAYVASGVAFTPTGGIASGNVQAAIAELDGEAAKKAANLSDLADAVAARLALGIPAIVAKGDIIAGSAADTLVKKAVGSDGQAVSADSSQTSGLVYIDNPSRPNLLVNPNWQIDQINEGALYTASGGAVTGPDGWTGSATGAGVFKLRTLADPDNAALKCLEITCTTADAAIAAGDNYKILTAVEGYDAAALMAGTASAQSVTLQFKFKTNVTGVYGVAVQNSATSRRYISIITVADTSEHEYSVTLAMDTSGTWLYTNGVGLYVILTLAAGSTFQSTAGAWAAGAEQTTSAQCNFMSANTNIAYLKRIQLIPGALVQAYKPADIQRELAKAQRYYAKTFPQGTAVSQAVGSFTGSISSDVAYANAAIVIGAWTFHERMRAAPTVTTYNPTQANTNWRRNDNAADTNRVVNQQNDWGAIIQGDSSTTVATFYYIHATANARLA